MASGSTAFTVPSEAGAEDDADPDAVPGEALIRLEAVSEWPEVPLPSPQRLCCEMKEFSRCQVTFDFDDAEAVLLHILNHHWCNTTPREMLCWFCPRLFTATSNDELDKRKNFLGRLAHIAEHYAAGDVLLRPLPDIYITYHIRRLNLIDNATFHMAVKRCERLRPDHFIKPKSSGSKAAEGVSAMQISSSRGRSSSQSQVRNASKLRYVRR